jgi:hypothetical protein
MHSPRFPEPVPLSVKDWVTKATADHTIHLQKQIVRFLLRAYGGLLGASVLIFLLQGFGTWGFKLSETVLKFIGTGTIGEIGGLLALTFRAVFVKKK